MVMKRKVCLLIIALCLGVLCSSALCSLNRCNGVLLSNAEALSGVEIVGSSICAYNPQRTCIIQYYYDDGHIEQDEWPEYVDVPVKD